MSPPSLRILMTADAVGGAWVYATSLARALCGGGHQVCLVTLGPPPRDDQRREVAGVTGLDLTVTDLALEWTDSEGRDFSRAMRCLAELERRLTPDIVHVNGYREACAAWRAPVVVVAHSCVCSWWRACHGDDPPRPQWAAYAANVRAGLAAAERWVAPTAAFRAEVEMLYAPPTRGQAIWNGLDPAGAPAPKEPFILSAGRLWDVAKNVSALARVAARIPWPLRVAGPLAGCGAAGRDFDASRVAWLGELPRADLIARMQRASIFAAPAVYEPFGLTVLEAALAGCALVLSDIPSFRELWGGAALFVDPRDGRAIESALTRLVCDRDLRRELQRAAQAHARRYSLASMYDAYCGLYRTMAGARRAVGGPPRRPQIEARP